MFAQSLSRVRDRLRRELGGESCALLAETVPSLAAVLQPSPGSLSRLPGASAVAGLTASEAASRFEHSLLVLIRLFAADQPVVLFFDDLQWGASAAFHSFPSALSLAVRQTGSPSPLLRAALIRTVALNAPVALLHSALPCLLRFEFSI